MENLLILLGIALACFAVGGVMLVIGMIYAVVSTYPPPEEGETRQ